MYTLNLNILAAWNKESLKEGPKMFSLLFAGVFTVTAVLYSVVWVLTVPFQLKLHKLLSRVHEHKSPANMEP